MAEVASTSMMVKAMATTASVMAGTMENSVKEVRAYRLCALSPTRQHKFQRGRDGVRLNK